MNNSEKKTKKTLKFKAEKKNKTNKFKVGKQSKLKEKYTNKTFQELLELSTNTKDMNDNSIDFLRNTLNSKSGSYRNDIYNSLFKIYPDYEDPNFNEKIYSKLEFYLNKADKNIVDNSDPVKLENHSKKLCNITGKKSKKFNLTKNQRFLKAFLSNDTPYNSMLLFHGTGVGKTCTSITIAEQYSNELKELNKKIFIVLNPSIKANFLKNIYNLNKLESEPLYQCTQDKYIKEIPDFDTLYSNKNFELIKKKITKVIKNKYSFFGYQKLANIVKKMEKNIELGVDDKKKRETLLKEKIKDYFSDSVLIIDEAQNVKEGEMGKMLPPILNKIVRYSDNMKLILLSATPMFNTASEILWLINLMRMNDKKTPLKQKDYFDNNGGLKKDKEPEFVKNTQGYISYMRGEDPYRFPKRIFTKDHPKYIKHASMPQKDKNEKPIENTIKYLHLIGCPMKGKQLEIYKKLEKAPTQKGSFNTTTIMSSNIVFPNSSRSNKTENYIGDEGFNSVIQKNKNGKKIKYSLKNIDENIFKKENLENYSTKISTFIENIEKSEGIVFIYSRFINSGVVPVALALEMNGYKKYDGSILESKDKPETKGSYIIISGDKDLSKNAYENYIKRIEENKNGEEIKIIIGSETASEGLDFSYIREVHILEPWFHLNKIEQVIGRAIRNCSHIGLEPSKRNVKIFMYASVFSDSEEKETIDIEIYRKAELKHKQMADVEYLIKTNAVDCNINYHNNRFFSDIGDDYSMKCNYRKCDYKCNPQLDDFFDSIDNSTSKINPRILKDGVEDIVNQIKMIFKQKENFKLDEILNIILGKKKRSLKHLVYFALNKMITEQTIIKDKNGNKGFIYYINGIYIFSPIHYKNKVITHTLNTKKYSKKKIKLDAEHIYLGNNLSLNKNNDTDKKSMFFNKYKKYLEELEKVKMIEGIDFSKLKDTYIDIIPYISNSSKDKEQRKKIKNKDELRITPEEKELILRTIIEKHGTGTPLTDEEEIVISKSYNILRFKDIFRSESQYKPNKPDDIAGYRIVQDDSIVYYRYNEGSFEIIEDKGDIQFNIQKKIRDKKISKFIGYLEYIKKKNSVVFKIRENNTNAKKTKIKRGSICSDKHGKKNEVIDYIRYLNQGENKDKITAVIDNFQKNKIPLYDLCMFLELLMIYTDLNSEEKCFFNPIETIEYELKI